MLLMVRSEDNESNIDLKFEKILPFDDARAYA